MPLTVELPPNVEREYAAEAKARGLAIDTLIREVLISNQPSAAGTEHGCGLFADPEEAALLDEAVALALEERHRPSSRI